MIQRIQTLWLFLAAIAMFFALRIPFAIETNEMGQSREVTADSNLPAFLLGILLCLGALVIIFLFRRRSNQKRMIWLSILTCVLFIVLMYFQVEEIKSSGDQRNTAKFKIGAVCPILYIILMTLAYTGIRKDEKLIKSVDRLR